MGRIAGDASYLPSDTQASLLSISADQLGIQGRPSVAAIPAGRQSGPLSTTTSSAPTFDSNNNLQANMAGHPASHSGSGGEPAPDSGPAECWRPERTSAAKRLDLGPPSPATQTYTEAGLHSDVTISILRNVQHRPLASSPPIDAELWTWVGIVLREYVVPWYAAIAEGGPLTQDIVDQLCEFSARLGERIGEADPAVVVQDATRILDNHLVDLDVAMARAKQRGISVEQAFLALEPHAALVEDADVGTLSLRPYLRDSAQLLMATLLPKLPVAVASLVAELLSLVLVGVFGALSEPWMIHELIVKATDGGKLHSDQVLGSSFATAYPTRDSPTRAHAARARTRSMAAGAPRAARISRPAAVNIADATNVVSPSTAAPQSADMTVPRGFSLLRTLLAPRPRDENPFLLWFAQHRVFQGAFGSFLFASAWPAHNFLAVLLNRVLRNALAIYAPAPTVPKMLSALRDAVFPGGRPGPARVEPSEAERAELRRKAAVRIPTAFGHHIIDISAFDSKLVNLRLLLAFNDYVVRFATQPVAGVVRKAYHTTT